MKQGIVAIAVFIICAAWIPAGFAAYHHEGERDSGHFLEVYPEKLGSKLDHCALCHSGGQYVDSKGRDVSVGSCQWCHYSYGYDGAGDIATTVNPFGVAYKNAGRNAAAITAIANVDSDEDEYTNSAEIQANTFPGNPADYPGLTPAPFRIYTKAQLMAMTPHSQFMLMNASREEDEYVEYTGVPMEDLLQDAGILPGATNIIVYAPDGFSTYHPLEPDPDPLFYHVNGTYPESVYYYNEEADTALNTADGWCDYSAPSCAGRNPGDPIVNPDDLKMILAYQRDGVFLDQGVLGGDNKLAGEGPFRVVPPQKNPGPPDQSSRAENQEVIWPYDFDWDHNKGFASRSATIIKVEPLPAGTTDIDISEAGWPYIDQEKIIIYGAIDGTDQNGNGIPDVEEGTGGFDNDDVDDDGVKDWMDPDTACLRHAKGISMVRLHTSSGVFKDVMALDEDDPAVPQGNRPSNVSCPYGTIRFRITGLNLGETVTVTLEFPGNVNTNYQYYKIDTTNGWHEIPCGGLDDGDNLVTLQLTDGDPDTDSDSQQNGEILDPGALTTVTGGGGSSGGGGGCFISATAPGAGKFLGIIMLGALGLAVPAVFIWMVFIRGVSQKKGSR
jgi:hypothetical protein